MKKKQWKRRSAFDLSSPQVRELADSLGITPVTSLLLCSRGVEDPGSARSFLARDRKGLYDPFLMKDMDRAAERIAEAIANNENIVIYGDYDVDGVTSVSILYEYLSECGASLSYYVPSREKEGYGVNTEAVSEFAERGVSLIITVDTGITAVEEVSFASSLGIDTVITDHHECQSTLPPARAVVDPKRQDCSYPFSGLAGVGVAFKLICAIEILRNPGRDREELISRMCGKYIDLVAVGTVADVMPLTDENRILVGLGIDAMKNSTRESIAMLLAESGSKIYESGSVSGLNVSSSTISFTLAPRINAAGRMESADIAVELFLSKDPDKTRALAVKLCNANIRRQEEENKIVQAVSERIGSEGGDRHIIVLSDDGWSSGIIGIVASRITEKYGVPSILVTFDEDSGRGSGRSVPGIDLVEALSGCSDLLIKYGGHSLAAGLAIERKNFDKFRDRIESRVASLIRTHDIVPVIEYDCELSSRDISLRQIAEQSCLEPFGVSNPAPLFRMNRVRITDIMDLKGGKHTRLTVSKDGIEYTALMFGTRRDSLDVVISDEVDLLFSMSENEFRGNTTLQLIVKAISLSQEPDLDALRARYSEIKKGAKYGREENILPSRDEIAQVYRYIKDRAGGFRDDRVSLRRMAGDLSGKVSYLQIRASVAVLEGAGLISGASSDLCPDLYRFAINYVRSKVDIEKSPVYMKLKGQCVK